MPNTLILINGHPNSGKSTTRKLLKEKLVEYDEWIEIDYDRNIVDALGNNITKENFIAARGKVLTLALIGVLRTNVVFDILITNALLKEYLNELQEYGVENIVTILLYCNSNARIARDVIRKQQNEHAPFGFTEGFDVAPDTTIYNLVIDTSKKTPIDIVNEIIRYVY